MEGPLKSNGDIPPLSHSHVNGTKTEKAPSKSRNDELEASDEIFGPVSIAPVWIDGSSGHQPAEMNGPSTTQEVQPVTDAQTISPEIPTPQPDQNVGKITFEGMIILLQSWKLANSCFSEYLALSELAFEWGDSYDDKDWPRLRAILAPFLMVSR